jgi:hypothetical protein
MKSILAKSIVNYNNKHLVYLPTRAFGPKAKKGAPAGGGGGGAPIAPYVPPKVIPTNFEVLVKDNGEDAFMFGPPSGVSKMKNAHRDYISPKLGTRMEFLAKSMRKQYMRDAIYPDSKIFLDPLRLRKADDDLVKLNNNFEVAACIGGREEFPELDLVFPNRTPFTIKKADHGLVRPFYMRWDD